jgi:hypothetical protein
MLTAKDRLYSSRRCCGSRSASGGRVGSFPVLPRSTTAPKARPARLVRTCGAGVSPNYLAPQVVLRHGSQLRGACLCLGRVTRQHLTVFPRS